MIVQRTGDLLHGFDAGSHGLAAPLVEELSGPGRRTIFPELLKGFLQKVGADGLEIVAKEVAQPEVLVVAKVLTATEQQPAGFPEDRGAALTSHAAGFLGTDVVQCLVHIGDDVKAVEDMQRLGAVFTDRLQRRSHTSEQTNTILEITSLPIAAKNPWKDSMVRYLPTQRRRVTPRSIW
jgi:hypothetical protein